MLDILLTGYRLNVWFLKYIKTWKNTFTEQTGIVLCNVYQVRVAGAIIIMMDGRYFV